MSRHFRNFDGAIEWVDRSILLSDEQKKVSIQKQYPAPAISLHGSAYCYDVLRSV